MLWHPSLPASTASETLPGNPDGGSVGTPWAPRSVRSVPGAVMSTSVDTVISSADDVESSATSPVSHSTSPLASSPLQDAPGMPQPPPPPPTGPRGLRWRRTPWRSAGGGRRRRGAGQRGGRQSWVGRGGGRGPMPGQWTSAKGSPPTSLSSAAGERRGRSGAIKKEPPKEDNMETLEESVGDPVSSIKEEPGKMEITRTEKEEEKGENDKVIGEEKDETTQLPKEKEEEMEEEVTRELKEPEEERIVRVTRQTKEDASVAVKSVAPSNVEQESNLIGAKKRKSNKVVKREVEPRVEIPVDVLPEVAPEVAQKEEKTPEEAVVEVVGSSESVAETVEPADEPTGPPEETRKEAKVQKGEDEEDMRYVCPICEDVLSSQHLFTVHIRSHNTPSSIHGDNAAGSASASSAASNGLKAFSCRICGKALSSSSSLDRHMLVHSGERPFKCRLCGVAFTTNGNMHRHMRTHAGNSSSAKEPEEVSDCGSSDSGGSKRGKVTPKKSPAPSTTTPSPGSGRKRTANGSNVDPASGRLQVREGCTPRTRTGKEPSEMGWRCLICDISFRNQKALRLHAYMAHRELEPDEEEEEDFEDDDYEEEERCSSRKRTRRCGEREERSASQPNQTHTLGFQDLTFVDFSTQKFPLIARVVCEKSIHRASSEFHHFQCDSCDRAFPCGSALHIHAHTNHRASSTSPTAAAPPAADDPKEDFFAVLNLQNKTRCDTSPPPTSTQQIAIPPHVRFFTPSNSPSLSHLPYAERKRREEEFDNAFYFNSPAMKPKDLHVGRRKTSIRQTDDDPGREASEAPKDLADINSIISAVAGNGSEFMRPMEEEEEEEIEGGGYEEEEEEQEEEDATFATELREMKMRGEFPCKLCPSVFPNLRALKGHCRNHIAEIVEGPIGVEDESLNRHPCGLCGRRVASDKHGLMRHLRSHNGDRPFRCALCRYAFTTKANCERHLRNRHSKASREEVRRSVIYSPNSDDNMTVHAIGDNHRDYLEKGNCRQDSAFVHPSRQCAPPESSTPPTKLSALLTAITESKSLSRSEIFGKDNEKMDGKSKFIDKDIEMRMSHMQEGHMDDLSSVEELVKFTRSPSSAPLNMINGQITLPMHPHVFHPIPLKPEIAKETVTVGAEAPLDLSMDALDLSSKKVQDEPEDLSRPVLGKMRTNIPATTPPSSGGFSGGLLMPVRLPSAPTARPFAPPTSNSTSQLSAQVLKVEPSSTPISIGTPKMEIPIPSQGSFYPNSIQMYLNPQFPTATSSPARPPVGSFPYHHLPLPYPTSAPSLIPQLQPTQVQSPSLHPPPLLSPSVIQSLTSQGVASSYPPSGMPSAGAAPSMERFEKEILRNFQLTSGGSLVLDAASMNERLQAMAMVAVAAARFPAAATPSELPSKPVISQTKDTKPNDPVVTAMREANPSKEDNRLQSGVKMVIKNGVLMPKQKQRRYRTERPFACCHCSARFTLRSNMERHIKQQHPEFWSQRPRGGRRGGSGGLSGGHSSRTDTSPSASDARLSNSPDGPLPPAASLPSESAGKPSSENGSEDYRDDDMMDETDGSNMHLMNDDVTSNPDTSTNIDDPNNKAKDNIKKVISEEVKHAIAQQLKSKFIADCRSNPSCIGNDGSAKRMDTKDDVRKTSKDTKGKGNGDDEEDSGELVIDEEKMDTENDGGADKERNARCPETKEDESSGVDLASVSKLLDNASTQTFQQYFNPEEDEEMEEAGERGARRVVDEGYDGGEDGEDEEEEEGWKSGDETGGSKCASSGEEGSLRGNNNRGRVDERDDSLERKLASVTVEAATAADTEDKGKRRSAYSSAPNRVSCPYCMRKFPWRSSLRRHILTHTGQKPYKCAHCPLLFTTKSNCDRHLLRKHGRGNGGGSGSGGCGGSSSGAEDAVSVVSSSGGGALSPGGNGSTASSAYTMRNVPERPFKCSVCPSSTFSTQNNLKKHLATKHQNLQPPSMNHCGRLSGSPRGGSEKGGSLSSASSPRCATEERDVDDEEDEEGLVGAEDEEGVLDEEDDGDVDDEEEEGDFEEDEESVDGEGLCNGETHALRSLGNRKKESLPAQSATRVQDKISDLSPASQGKHHHLNGNLPTTASNDEGDQVRSWDKGHTPPPSHHGLQNHQLHLPTHHHHHHHHHPGSDLPFKCHLCERSYAERNDALNHIKDSHAPEYDLLLKKGALDSAAAVSSEDAHNNNHHHNGSNNNMAGGEQAGGEESLEQLRGKFPDYANRKVVCAFCMRRFWSAEDLRRHMRTHTGERPFSCDICARRFTLKHSMLRHRKKHSSAERASGGSNPMVVATSEASDEEAITTRQRTTTTAASDLVAINNHLKWEKNLHAVKDDEETEGKLRKLIPSEINLAAAAAAIRPHGGDLIGNLLGIQDRSIIDKILSKSADDAAKLLGVDGHD